MSRFSRILPLRLGWPNLLAALLWAGHLVAAQRAGLWSPARAADVIGALTGLCALQLLLQGLRAALGRSPRARAGVTLLLLFLANGLWSYQRQSRASFGYELLVQNAKEMFYFESWQVILSRIGWDGLFVGLGGILLLGLLERRRQVLSGNREEPPGALKALAAFGLFGALALSPLPAADGFTPLVRSIGSYYAESYPGAAPPPGTFPLVTEDPAALARTPVAPLPDITLVMIESFAAGMAERQTADGREVAPVFNALAREAVSVERFYGNSIQTSKGQFATLFSAIPSIRGKEFERFGDRSFLSLPSLLRRFGYRTVFLQAYKNTEYDNTRDFLTRNGFDIVQPVSEFMAPGDQASVWGWGLQDDLFYRRCLERLDAIRRESGDRPLFVVLATISSHMPFTATPAALQELYPRTTAPLERFENAIHLADKSLSTLLDGMRQRPRLQAGLLLVTGDHSSPTGEHGYFSNEVHADEEFFRIPLALRWPGHLAPRRIADAPFSQMDIAPTLLDLLQLPVPRHPFEGVSLFDERRRLHPIFLVQPYAGRFLAVVEYPWKIVRHFDQDVLLNLATDPDERTDLSGRPELAPVLARLRARLQQMYAHQRLLEADAIWPRGAPTLAPPG